MIAFLKAADMNRIAYIRDFLAFFCAIALIAATAAYGRSDRELKIAASDVSASVLTR